MQIVHFLTRTIRILKEKALNINFDFLGRKHVSEAGKTGYIAEF